MRWLILIVLAGLGWVLWKGLLRAKQIREASAASQLEQERARAQAAKEAEAHPLAMVRCAHCSAWSPESLAFKQQGQWFCDESHAKAKFAQDASGRP